MSYKQVVLNNHQITIYKRKAARSLRLTLTPNGQVKVSIPAWASYQTGINFALSKEAWISQNKKKAQLIEPNQAIGKAHHLHFVASPNSTKISSRITSTSILISHPENLDYCNETVQKIASQAATRALRKQAQALLPQRLAHLAKQHGLSYNSIGIKLLRSRWGSCDSKSNIVLSLYLMQMPWELIDYVILHELSHTKVLQHGPKFWDQMEQVLPGARQIKHRLKAYQPVVNGLEPSVMA